MDLNQEVDMGENGTSLFAQVITGTDLEHHDISAIFFIRAGCIDVACIFSTG